MRASNSRSRLPPRIATQRRGYPIAAPSESLGTLPLSGQALDVGHIRERAARIQTFLPKSKSQPPHNRKRFFTTLVACDSKSWLSQCSSWREGH